LRRVRMNQSTLSLLMVVTLSFTSHNHFVFWIWNVSYQMPCPTCIVPNALPYDSIQVLT
jgi:hypothetical protein